MTVPIEVKNGTRPTGPSHVRLMGSSLVAAVRIGLLDLETLSLAEIAEAQPHRPSPRILFASLSAGNLHPRRSPSPAAVSRQRSKRAGKTASRHSSGREELE